MDATFSCSLVDESCCCVGVREKFVRRVITDPFVGESNFGGGLVD